MEKELEELRQENEKLQEQLTGSVIPEADLERIAAAVAAKLKGESAPSAKKTKEDGLAESTDASEALAEE